MRLTERTAAALAVSQATSRVPAALLHGAARRTVGCRRDQRLNFAQQRPGAFQAREHRPLHLNEDPALAAFIERQRTEILKLAPGLPV